MKKKVIIFGDLPIATKVTIDLLKRKNVELIGVVTSGKKFNNNDPWENTPTLGEFAKLNKIQILSLKNLSSVKSRFDIGFSCRFSQILTAKIIKKFSQGIINFHGGLLPECAGLFSSCHSILLKHKKGGGTLHYVDSRVDTGNIIKRKEFKINKKDTSISVFKKTQVVLLKAYYEVAESIINGNNLSVSQKEFIAKGIERNYFNKNSLKGKKKIKINSSKDDILRVVRAFDHPNHEPAYMKINGIKVYLSTMNSKK